MCCTDTHHGAIPSAVNEPGVLSRAVIVAVGSVVLVHRWLVFVAERGAGRVLGHVTYRALARNASLRALPASTGPEHVEVEVISIERSA